MSILVKSCWLSAPIYALVGMVFGIWMSASGQHQFAPAHAQLNLLGWVSIAIFGAYYTLFPQSSTSMLVKIQLGAMHLGTILMFPGVIMAINGTGDGLAKAGSLLTIVSMVLFVVIVARTRDAAR